MGTEPQTVSIVGIGDDGLGAVSESVRRLILEAQLLVGKERTLALVPEATGERLEIGSELDEVVDRIQQSGDQRVAVLVIGDPLFYGLARFLCDRLGHDRCEIVPHVSSMQLAFARVKESWDEAYLTNLANHSIDTIVERIRVAGKVGLFTTEACGPAQVARALLDQRIDYFTGYVCENLGARDERVTYGTLAEIAQQNFDSLNVFILIRESDAPDRSRDPVAQSLFGNPDELFIQSKPRHGLLTPAEVRAMALAQMALSSRSIVWDVGAGCGAVSIEAAQLAPGGQVFAIEPNPEEQELIGRNAERFSVSNVVQVAGKAPDAWADLPDPDAVFLEGSGREVVQVAQLAFARLRSGGRLVANVISIDALQELRQTLMAETADVREWMISLARGTDQMDRLVFDSLNPTFLIAAVKP